VEVRLVRRLAQRVEHRVRLLVGRHQLERVRLLVRLPGMAQVQDQVVGLVVEAVRLEWIFRRCWRVCPTKRLLIYMPVMQ
jgi:hypothetical protein